MAWMFRVLGPLAVECDGVELAMGPAKRRRLLAALLIDANRMVTVDRLVELLWEGEPPRSAVANIRTYACQLRAAFVEPERVVRRPPGYVFAASEAELDLLAYKGLVENGRKALAGGDVAGAVSRFADALSIWRGAAAEDVSRTNRLGACLAGLDEQRVALIETWMEARLSLGDHRDAVGELRRLTEEHPLRERLWGQLMLALYRTGSTGAALRAFEQARRVLIDQLGIEPGPELTRLHAAVLRHDPGLLADTSAVAQDQAPARPRPVPRELPPDVAVLVGRERALAAVRVAGGDGPGGAGARRSRPAMVAIHGPGGAGKSALAIHAAHDLRHRYPDGQIYVNLHGSSVGTAVDPASVLRRFLRALGAGAEPAVASDGEAAARFRSLTADRKMIILLDNAVDEAQVRPLLPGSAEALVLITSRRMLAALDGPVHVELGPISADAADALLGRLAGPERAAAEPEALSRLASLCGRLPLALRVTGARLASAPSRSLSALAAELSDERGRLDALWYGDLGVRPALAVSYRQLAAGAQLFRLLGRVRVPDVSGAVASAVLDAPVAATERVLNELVDARLLEQTRSGRYRMHDLVRLYAGELGVGDDVRPALHRVLCCYLSTTRRAVAMLRPGANRHGTDQFVEESERIQLDGPAAALAWLNAERVNMIALARQVYDAELDLARSVPLLAALLYPYLAAHGYRDELGELGELAGTVAARLGDRAANAGLRSHLNTTCARAAGAYG
jgi:DNA-binding SARP family transcriptional activator